VGPLRERSGRRRLPAGVLPAAGALSVLALVALVLTRPASRGRRARREERAAWALLAPWAAGFALFLLGPALVAGVLSLCEWSPLRALDDVRWVGLDNYARLASDPTFHASARATALYALGSVPLGLALALALALLVERASSASALVRTACYVPVLVAPVIVAALWRVLLEEDGPVNGALRALGITGPAWLRDPAWVVPAFVLVSLWSVGAQMLVFLAALQARERTLEEAARIDGAGPWRRFAHVTLPGLAPVVLFNAITGTVAACQVFAQPYVMTQGGPGDASRFLVLYLYESAFQHLELGYASALAWALFAGLGVLTFLFLRAARRRVYYAGRAGGGPA